jgi:dipeptidyl aminopeptidase/acylaminoacyl peptidase
VRARYETTIYFPSQAGGAPLETPPAGIFERVTYPSEVGALGAYITPDPRDGSRHPAIIWLTGGESNTLGDVWTRAPRDNDQSARAYRDAGVVMMFPTLRGGNDNPGQVEGMYGEVDDILAAADYLAAIPYVDPARIYLGGHSTGGTLVFLVAEASDRFRAVFSFGPVAAASQYGPDLIPADFERLPDWEHSLRAPALWMGSVRAPLFVIEGTEDTSNVDMLRYMRARTQNPNIHFIEVPGTSHFSVLAPANELIARRILTDTGATSNISLSAEELAGAIASK